MSLELARIAYSYFPNSPSARYQGFLGVSATLVALLSFIAAIATFWINSNAARRSSRVQHTLTILFETRLSEQFLELNRQRSAVFPTYEDIDPEAWKKALKAEPAFDGSHEHDRAARLRLGAQAVGELLNYYEFLAVGIHLGDLDEEMLKKTVRGLMCNLVDDARILISEIRKTNPAAFQNLVVLYSDWRRHDAIDVNGNPTERPIPA